MRILRSAGEQEWQEFRSLLRTDGRSNMTTPEAIHSWNSGTSSGCTPELLKF
jgi:hypothetical protein